MSGVNNYVLNCAFKDVLKLFKEDLVRIDCGSAFHNFEAEYEKERSYNAVRDLGTERSPFSDDLKLPDLLQITKPDLTSCRLL